MIGLYIINGVILLLLAINIIFFRRFQKSVGREQEMWKLKWENAQGAVAEQWKLFQREQESVRAICDELCGAAQDLKKNLQSVKRAQKGQDSVLGKMQEDSAQLETALERVGKCTEKMERKLAEVDKKTKDAYKQMNVIEEIFRIQLVNSLLDDANDAITYYRNTVAERGK